MTISKHHLSITIIIFFIIFLHLQCANHLATNKPHIIEVKHQSINLQPISGLHRLELHELWPANKTERDFLLEQFDQVWKNLLAEFRRCEKYGLYTIVDSTGSSTVTITPGIVSMKIRNDTLHIPMEIKTYNTSEKRSAAVTIDAFGVCPTDTTSNILLQKLGKAFADYRRRFPYKNIVSLFYTSGYNK